MNDTEKGAKNRFIFLTNPPITVSTAPKISKRNVPLMISQIKKDQKRNCLVK